MATLETCRNLCRNNGQGVNLVVVSPGVHRIHGAAAGHIVARKARFAFIGQQEQTSRSNLRTTECQYGSADTKTILTAENVLESPLPQPNTPPLTPQVPFDDESFKLLALPDSV
jgi:hypothetical protein